jgi:hypothetical protein
MLEVGCRKLLTGEAETWTWNKALPVLIECPLKVGVIVSIEIL